MDTSTRSLVVYLGARPNGPKVWTLLSALHRYTANRLGPLITWQTVHTGQHHDRRLGPQFCAELGLPLDGDLAIGTSVSDGAQIGMLTEAIEADLGCRRPSAVLVVGDVNSTLVA